MFPEFARVGVRLPFALLTFSPLYRCFLAPPPNCFHLNPHTGVLPRGAEARTVLRTEKRGKSQLRSTLRGPATCWQVPGIGALAVFVLGCDANPCVWQTLGRWESCLPGEQRDDLLPSAIVKITFLGGEGQACSLRTGRDSGPGTRGPRVTQPLEGAGTHCVFLFPFAEEAGLAGLTGVVALGPPVAVTEPSPSATGVCLSSQPPLKGGRLTRDLVSR